MADTVRCPICLHVFPWPDRETTRELYVDTGTNFVPLDADHLDRLRAQRDRLAFHSTVSRAYIPCPNPFAEPDHWLPMTYGDHGNPFVIGMVGTTSVGKSHLLAAMIGELAVRQAGADLGLDPRAVYRRRHVDYQDEFVLPLLQVSRGMPPSPPKIVGEPTEFVDALTLNLRGGRRTVAFFDVSGEDLRSESTSSRFIEAANGLIFVVDPVEAGLGRSAHSSLTDPTFGIVLSQLSQAGRVNRRSGLADVAAAVVVGKADLLRHEPIVARWYYRDRLPGALDQAEIEEESTAVYSLLHAHGAGGWLAPVEACQRASLHFASATGGRSRNITLNGEPIPVYPRHPRPLRPRRVLEPLLAVLAMGGLLPTTGPGVQVGI
jgi:GTPase SAR1 family protein